MWMLYEKCANGEYIDIGCGPTGDNCKTKAKRVLKNRPQSEFLIRDPSGREWMKSVNTGSWRMKWVWAQISFLSGEDEVDGVACECDACLNARR